MSATALYVDGCRNIEIFYSRALIFFKLSSIMLSAKDISLKLKFIEKLMQMNLKKKLRKIYCAEEITSLATQ